MEKQVAEFLQSGTLMRLATVSADGEPHVVPVWYELDGDIIRVGTHTKTAKAKNVRAVKRAAFCVDVSVNSPIRGVAGSGAASLITEPARAQAIARRIIARYIDADSESARELLAGTDCVIEVSVERASSWSY